MDALDVRIPTAGILYQKALPIPVRYIGDSVTGNARVVFYHCFATAKETIDQRRLAHIRATHDGYRAQSFFGVIIGLNTKSTGEFLPFLFA